MTAFDAINAASIQRARATGWPELSGSDAQVGWSFTVREKKMREFEAAAVCDPESRAR
ncbi:hypothetical protein [Nocardia sp.]|uniref:hypothetical protein n=1 Tax=Nocardia sp. TaxID=1821 RepID=UPI0026204782|nr:hypothetical protein [Nocardia sp.]